MTSTAVQARPPVMAEGSASIVSPQPPASTSDVGVVELTDLSRFEGEGGREAPEANVIEARPEAARRYLAANLPDQNQLMTKETNAMKPIPEASQNNGDSTANVVARKTQAVAPAEPNAPVGAPQHFRRLKPGEVVGRGDFVANEQCRLEPWEGPGGFRAGAFVKPIYRRKASRLSATKKSK